LSASAGSLGLCLAPSYWLLLGVALVASIGRATVLPVALAISSTRFAEATSRRRAIGWIVSGISLAAIVGIPALTTIAAQAGWRAAFLALAAGCLLVVPLVQWTVPAGGGAAASGSSWRCVLEGYPPLLRHGPSIGLIGSNLLNNVAVWSIWTYTGAYFAQRSGLSIQEIGLVYLLGGSALVAGSLLASRQRGRDPRSVIAATRAVAGLLFGLAFVLPFAAPLSALLIALALLVVGVSAVLNADLLALESPAGKATTLALSYAANSLGTALGAGLGGLALSLGDYPAVSACALAAGLGSAALAWRTRTLSRDLLLRSQAGMSSRQPISAERYS
jgi:predicted MFS family arabinose efflux permease